MQCYLCTYLETHSVPNCDIISERVSYGHRTRQHQDAYAERNYPTAGLKTLVSSCTDYFRTVWYCAKGWCRRGIWSPTGSYHKVCCQKIAPNRRWEIFKIFEDENKCHKCLTGVWFFSSWKIRLGNHSPLTADGKWSFLPKHRLKYLDFVFTHSDSGPIKTAHNKHTYSFVVNWSILVETWILFLICGSTVLSNAF